MMERIKIDFANRVKKEYEAIGFLSSKVEETHKAISTIKPEDADMSEFEGLVLELKLKALDCKNSIEEIKNIMTKLKPEERSALTETHSEAMQTLNTGLNRINIGINVFDDFIYNGKALSRLEIINERVDYMDSELKKGLGLINDSERLVSTLTYTVKGIMDDYELMKKNQESEKIKAKFLEDDFHSCMGECVSKRELADVKNYLISEMRKMEIKYSDILSSNLVKY